LGLWLALGGYKRLTTPNPRWQLPNGHTVEILANHPQRGFGPDSDDLKLSRYALVQFRSTLQDSVRDVNDIHAIADLICQSADSLGYRLIKVEATANPWFAIVRLSRARWFRIDSDGECHQFESLQ
jgi:hypothetical protein